MSSDTELEARDIRAGYIAWCRGELPAVLAGEKFDRLIAKVKADALREAGRRMRAQVERATEYQRFTEHELIEHGIEQVLSEYADRIEEEA